jgi:hypothetical protein
MVAMPSGYLLERAIASSCVVNRLRIAKERRLDPADYDPIFMDPREDFQVNPAIALRGQGIYVVRAAASGPHVDKNLSLMRSATVTIRSGTVTMRSGTA